MIRPTGRAVLLFAVSVPLALVLVTTVPGMWNLSLLWPGAVAVLIFADWSMLPGDRLVGRTWTLPRRLYIGEAGRAEIDLTVPGRDIAVSAILDLRGEVEEIEEFSGATSNGRGQLAVTLRPLRRGRVRAEALWLRWRGPLGLVERSVRQVVGEDIDVVPNIRGIHDEALYFFANETLHGLKSRNIHGEGSEYDRLTDFQTGMDNRFIDWKRSARHRKLLAKEFRQERNNHVVFGLDTGHLMLEPIHGSPRLDHAIRAALTLAWVSLRWGDVAGGCGFDAAFRGYVEPGRGMRYFTQLQRFFAGLDYHTEETNYTLGLTELSSRLKRRTLVILFTDFVDSISAELLLESLGQMARRHLVVFVTMRDPLLAGRAEAWPGTFVQAAEAVIADDFLRDRRVVLERISRSGVHVLETTAGNVTPDLVNRYLLIKQRGLL